MHDLPPELKFDLLSLNTRGIGGYRKRRKVFNYLKKHSSHNAVIFLQKTHSTKIVEKVWLNQWGCGTGNIILSHGASDSRGVLIAFREDLDIEIRTCICDKNGRYIILHAHIQDNPILLVNYCAPMMKVLRFKLCQKYVTLLIKWSWNRI